MELNDIQILAALQHAAPIPKDPVPLTYGAIATLLVLAAVQVQQRYRAAFVPAIAASFWAGLVNGTTAFHGFAWCYAWGLFMVIFFLYSMHKLFIDPRVPSTPQSAVPGGHNWLWAYKTISERTLLQTSSQTSRATFFLNRLASIVVVGASLTILPQYIFPGPFEPLGMQDFDPDHQEYFRRLLFAIGPPVTVRETALRCAFVLFAGSEMALQLTQCHNLLAVFFVCVAGLDQPDDWPSFYSSVSEIVSLRTFWARFWHRVIVRTYAGLAGYFSRNGLGLKPRGQVDRLVVHALVFSISGAVHSLTSWAFGQTCETWRDWAWFAGTFPAILLEDRLLAAVGWLTGSVLSGLGVAKDSKLRQFVTAKVKVATGIAWLFWWFFWTVPKLYYPKAYCLPAAFS